MVDRYISLLYDLNTKKPSTKAQNFIDDILSEEINYLRQHSVFDSMHDHVTRYGYPIDDEKMAQSSYVPRIKLEKKLKKHIKNNANIILLGCEGSGKTTIIHKVANQLTTAKEGRFLYVDASNISSETSAGIDEAVYKKIANSIIRNTNTQVSDAFDAWFAECQKDTQLHAIVSNRTQRDLTEAFLAFLRIYETQYVNHIIIDNIDSASIEAGELIFSSLKNVEDTASAICAKLGLTDNNNIRYIISCRTTTYELVTGTAKGLFAGDKHEVLEVEDDFLNNTNIIDIIKKFLLNEKSDRYARALGTRLIVPISNYSTATMNLVEYFESIIKWLNRARDEVDKTIKFFSGRSIRRAKLYALKLFSNPNIGRLAYLENKRAYNLSTNITEFMHRKIREAIFDYSGGNNFGLRGYPINPFKVVEDASEFKNNPLIGVVGLIHLYENRETLFSRNIEFASVVDITALYELLSDISYTENAIKDFFSSCRKSGIIRPIKGASILLSDSVHDKNIYDKYVIDEKATKNIYELLTGSDIKTSITFFNGSLRAYYRLGHSRFIDNWFSECYTSLVFLRIFYKRERILAEMLEGRQAILMAPSEKFAGKLLRHVSNVMTTFESKELDKNAKQSEKIRENIYIHSLELLESLKGQARKNASVLK